MAYTHNAEFKREAVRIALMRGLSRKQVASDFGIGFSTLAKWRAPQSVGQSRGQFGFSV